MASNYRTKQKKQLILALLCCVLVLAILAATVIISMVHKASLYSDFEDKDFATAIAQALGFSSKYDLEAEDLDRFEGLIYYCNVGIDTTNGYTPYAYPVVMLCDKTYTDVLMKQSDPDFDGEVDSNVDYSQNIVQVPYVLTNPEDLNMFRNLRMLRAFDLSEVNAMAQGCQTTQLYQMYGMTQQSYDLTTVVNASKMDEFTSLTQIASLTKLEQLSICYTGVTSLEGIENFPNLNKLDATYTLINSIEGLDTATNLTFLSLNSINVTPEEEDEHDHDHESSTTESSTTESSEDDSSLTDEEKEEKEEEKEEAEEEEVVYNTTGLSNEDLALIAKLSNLKYLDIANNNITDLSALSVLSGVKYLSVAQNPVASLKGIENMKNLELLHALDCQLTEIDAITGFAKLENVYLSNNKLTTLAPLANATQVLSLDVSDNELTDASAVSGMTKLTSLTLTDNNLTTLSDLSKLDRLGSLDASDNRLNDVSGLEKFNPQYPGMTDEDIEAAKKETDKKDEEKNENTVTINLADNNITFISLSATKLGSLDLSKNKLHVTEDRDSAMVFTGCDKLTSLTLTENDKLTSLEGVETLTGLTTLNASKSAIVTIPELKGLKSLTTVNLAETDIADINGLKDNESITTLTLTQCEKLTDISVLNTIKKLSTVTMGKCTALTDESIKNAFGTPKTGDKEAELKFDKTTKLTVTITGCEKITNFDIFASYGNMTVNYDKPSTKK